MRAAIRRVIRNQVVLTLALTIPVVLLMGWLFIATTLPYFQAMWTGGHQFTPAQLVSHTDTSPVYFTRVKGAQMYDTGYYYETVMNGVVTTSTDYFGALAVEDRFLLVKLPYAVSETELDYRGTLLGVTSEYRREIIADIEAQAPELRGLFLPVYLDVSDAERNWGWYVGAVVLAVTTLFCGYWIIESLRRLAKPERHPIMKKLARFGSDVDQLLGQVEYEISGGQKVGKLKLSNRWLVHQTGSRFDLMRLDQVMWLYKHILRTKAYGVVTTSKQVSAMIYDQHGVNLTVTGKEKDVDAMLVAVAQRAPHAVIGYAPEIKRLWDKQRDDFIRQVKARMGDPADSDL